MANNTVKKKQVFSGNLRGMPDLAKTYLFDVHIYNKKNKQTEYDLNVRCKEVLGERYLYFDEFQDFYVSKYFDNLKDNRFKLIIEFYNSQLTKVVYKKMIDCKLQIRPFVSLNQEDNVKLTRMAKIIKKGSFEYDDEG